MPLCPTCGELLDEVWVWERLIYTLTVEKGEVKRTDEESIEVKAVCPMCGCRLPSYYVKEEVLLLTCPKCGSKWVKQTKLMGADGKRGWKCQDCGHEFRA